MKFYLFLASLFLATALSSQNGNRFPEAPKARLSAIVVGVSRYEHIKNIDLKYADRDAIQFSKLLGCAKNVEIDTVITLVNEKATTGNFLAAIDYLGRSVSDSASNKPDYLMIYFSGHGRLGPEVENREGYFVMYNTVVDDSEAWGFAHRKLVMRINNILLRNNKVIIISDACHSGRLKGMGGSAGSSVNLPVLPELSNFSSEENRVLEILSSEGGKPSYESSAYQHGVFTYYLIKGLEGEAYKDREGEVSVEALVDYLRKKLKDEDQKPVSNNYSGEFITFDSCLNYSSTNIISRSEKKVVKTVVVNEGLVNEFYRYLDEGKLVSSKENCAFKILMTIKNNDKLSATYPELRSAFIGAVIDEDTKIYYKYLNQDVFPWYSKFYDIEKEIQMQESLLQILKSDDFMYRSSCSKYYFYQAMTLYEFAKLEYEGKKRENRFKKAQKLIKIAIKLNENSPVLKMMQNRIDLAISRKNTAELKRYEEARLLAPDWRIPYIYSDNAKSARKYEELIVDFDRRTMEKAVTIPNLTYLSVKNRKKSNIYDPAIFKQSFESNPFILEDVYLNRILHSKTPGQYLSFHIPLAREAYDRSVRHSYGDKSENRNYQYSELISHVDTISENNKIAERLSINEILAEFNQWGRYPTIEDPLAGKFILVKSGLFRMGCMNQTENCRMIPAHDVILGDFYIGETEVTWAQWKAVMGTEASKYVFKCDSCPVENLSWEDVQRFIKILNLRTGKKYRLPTEAEWEYAARGGRKSNRYAFAGNSDVDSVAWFGGNSGSRLRPQKLKLPNELGLYDMSGNVQEWCSDWFAPYSDVSSFQINPQGPEQGSHRVARGGGWLSPSNNCRVTSRSSYPPNSKMYNLGFRLALTPVKLW